MQWRVGLLRDLPLIETIFKAVRAAVSIPFTVKFRMGWNDKHIVCVELAKMAEDCGLNAVALHARTREDGYTGQARWEWIAAVKDAVSDSGDWEWGCSDAGGCGGDGGRRRVRRGDDWAGGAGESVDLPADCAVHGDGAVRLAPTDEDRYRMIRDYFQMMVDEIEMENATRLRGPRRLRRRGSWRGRSRRGTAWAR